MDGKHRQLSSSMTDIRLWRLQYVRKYIDEGKSLCIVLSVFGNSLHDEIRTYYQSCLDDDDYPYTERVSDGEGLKVIP